MNKKIALSIIPVLIFLCTNTLHSLTTHKLLTLNGHKKYVNAVNWLPTNPYLLASAAKDYTVKIWDIRNPDKAIYFVSHHHAVGVKPVLSLAHPSTCHL